MSEAREMAARLRAYAKDQGGWHNIDDTCEQAADLIDRQNAEIEALKAATAWRPIETAPRDGTHILARLTRERILDMDGRMMPKFSEIREIWYQPFTMFGVSVPWHAGDPFDGDDIASTHMGDDVPTEWMPLPSAPKEPTP